MSKIVSIILGILAAIIGIMLLTKWYDSFIHMLKASLIAVLIVGGIVALIAGLGELKDELQDKIEKKSN